MKSLIEEASSVVKAIEKAWIRAGKPQAFSVKIFEESQTGFLGFNVKPAKVGIFFEESINRQERDQKRNPRPRAAQRPRNDRNERPERSSRPERNERPERSSRPERRERPERNEQPEKPERNSRPERNERPERSSRPERRERPERNEQPEKPERNERPERRNTKPHSPRPPRREHEPQKEVTPSAPVQPVEKKPETPKAAIKRPLRVSNRQYHGPSKKDTDS